MRRGTRFAAAAALATVLFAGAANAGTTVSVSLWDNGPDANDNATEVVPMGMAMGGDMSQKTMGITATPDSIPAGEVTFVATDDSTSLIHEMIVAPVVSEDQPLPYNSDTYRVDEDAAHSLGEVSELEPGDSGSLTVTLDPGEYILYCNIAGHYAMGMWTTITVE